MRAAGKKRWNKEKPGEQLFRPEGLAFASRRNGMRSTEPDDLLQEIESRFRYRSPRSHRKPLSQIQRSTLRLLSQPRFKNVITAGIVALVAIGILFNWAVPVSALNAAPATPDVPTLRALHKGMVEVDWNDVSGADRYEVQFFMSSGWTDMSNAGLGVEIFFYGSRAVATDLPEDMSYDAFRVRAGNSVGWSEWSEYAWQRTTHLLDWEGIPVSAIEPTPMPANSTATGAPTITSIAQVGETLTAETTGIADADGLDNASFAYQWLADDADISGATGKTYALTAADEGKTVKVQVSFTDDAGNEETLTSTATDAVAGLPNSPATGAPIISGTAQVGETLTAETTGIADADGLDNTSFAYQWLADDADISEETGSTYALTEADEGKTVKVQVSFTDDAANEETLTSTATDAVAGLPNSPATGAPTITGTAQVGETLTAETTGIADADGLDNASFAYQWLADDADISEETGSTYALTEADEGKTVKVQVSFTDDAANEETLTSTATDAVAGLPNSPATGAPTITGTAQVGETLTAETTGIADTDGLDNASFAYQWLADDADISEETGSTYALTEADEGKTVKVQVSFTDDAANEETLTSTATDAVAGLPNSPATGAPTITGTAQVGETLTAETTGIADADGLDNASFAYQWLADDADISEETGSTYALTEADEGKTVKVQVSFTDDAANEETLTSTATDAVAGLPNSPATGAPTITGTAQVGETLTAETTGIADTDGLDNASFAYQWLADDADISEETGSTYALTEADEGKTVKVQVSFTDDAANEETLTSTATDAVAGLPNLPDHFHDLLHESDNIGSCDIENLDHLEDREDVEDLDSLLLPDLVSCQHDYSVAEVVVAPDGTELHALRFAGFVTNLGDGPLDLKGNPQLADDADLTSHDVWQRALTVGGDWVNLTKPPLKFERVDGHGHFHLKGIVEYSLWDTSGTVEIRSGAKVGFCLLDVAERPDLHPNPGPQRYRLWDPDNHFCQSGRPGATNLHMGISEGWQDIYSFAAPFQWIDVSNVRPGYYRVGQRVDPDNIIVESDETNNGLALSQRLHVVPGYVARPETVRVEPDATVRFKLSADEYFEDGSPGTRVYRIVTQPLHGSLDVGDTVTLIVDGATHQVFTDEWVTYTPDPGYAGADSFTFVALDKSLPRYPIDPVVATVTIDIAHSANNPATGAPTIRGTAQVGETLTADTSGIGDTDGITGISYSYQWVRNDGTNDTDITGETDSTYTMLAADEGRTIKVGVSFTDDAGNEETLTSAATASVTARPEQGSAPDAPDLPIGTAVFVGGVDLEWNDVPGADSYEVQLFQNGQWTDLPGGGVEIAFYGAGAIISELDPDSTLWFQVRARNAHGSSDWSDFSSLSSTNQFRLGRQARPANEAASGAPVINGTAQVGEILTADTTGIEDGNGLDRVQFGFQWATNYGGADTDIAGATNSTYTLAVSDEGKTIKVRVAFTDRGGYAESLTSDATETVSFAGQQQIDNNPATGGPIIGGTARVGETLATDILGIADEDGLENATFSYQWISNDGTTDADIQGETGATYTLTDANEGKTVKVRVSFTDDADNEETVTSAATATVAARPNRPATGAPIIGGTARVGETLATDILGIADEDGLENATFSYQWISNDGTTDADIQGETGATYTLASAYVGKTIKVKVTFTDDADNEETLTSPATAEVAAGVPTDPPAKPRNLTGTANWDGTVTLRWNAPDDDSVTGYQILRRRPSEGERTLLVHVNDTGSTATEYTDNDVTADVLHAYRVKAINAVGLSRQSDFVNVTPTQPAKPTGLSAAVVSHDTVTLTWDNPQDDTIIGYVILRRDREIHPVGTFVTITGDTSSADTTYTDDTVEPDKQYVYRIKAINKHGEVSEKSDWVRADTPAAPAPAGSPPN